MLALKLLRKTKKISQQQLAGVLGVSRSTVAMWESGASQPDNDSLCSIADFFQVSVDYLLDRETTPTAEAVEVTEEDKQLAILLQGLSEDNKHKAREYLDFLKSKQNQ